MTDKQLSKYLSLLLRHKPQELRLKLEPDGWTSVEALLSALKQRSLEVSRADLERIVAADEKQRYALRGGRIRANQGHSVEGVCAVEPIPVDPPPYLYHGTEQRWDKIQASPGLKPGTRHHVHLSQEIQTARTVGSRHRGEKLLLLRVRAQDFAQRGGTFLRSENGVWMAGFVPLEFIEKID